MFTTVSGRHAQSQSLFTRTHKAATAAAVAADMPAFAQIAHAQRHRRHSDTPKIGTIIYRALTIRLGRGARTRSVSVGLDYDDAANSGLAVDVLHTSQRATAARGSAPGAGGLNM